MTIVYLSMFVYVCFDIDELCRAVLSGSVALIF